MKILISGATGFIGSRLIPKLSKSYKIFAITREVYKNLNPRVNWIKQDLAQPLDYSKFPKKLDSIIHLAQSRHYKNFPEKAHDIFDVNIKGTFNLLEYGRKIGLKNFIFASSGRIDDCGYERLIKSTVSSLNFYLTSKYSAELIIANYKNFFKTIVFRFFFVYGEGQRERLFPQLLDKIEKNKVITIIGKEGISINPIYVEDAIRVFEPALVLPSSEIFDIAGDERINIKNLVLMMAQLMKKKTYIKHIGKENPASLIGNNKRMKERLGIYPNVDLKAGILRMINYEEK